MLQVVLLRTELIRFGRRTNVSWLTFGCKLCISCLPQNGMICQAQLKGKLNQKLDSDRDNTGCKKTRSKEGGASLYRSRWPRKLLTSTRGPPPIYF
jgi:hypothetical protein